MRNYQFFLRDPVEKRKHLMSKEIKRRTGFKTENDLLAFVVVICNANKSLIESTCSNLTWFEE